MGSQHSTSFSTNTNPNLPNSEYRKQVDLYLDSYGDSLSNETPNFNSKVIRIEHHSSVKLTANGVGDIPYVDSLVAKEQIFKVQSREHYISSTSPFVRSKVHGTINSQPVSLYIETTFNLMGQIVVLEIWGLKLTGKDSNDWPSVDDERISTQIPGLSGLNGRICFNSKWYALSAKNNEILQDLKNQSLSFDYTSVVKSIVSFRSSLV